MKNHPLERRAALSIVLVLAGIGMTGCERRPSQPARPAVIAAGSTVQGVGLLSASHGAPALFEDDRSASALGR
ncbi:MAG TPA: hypothetical protein PK359_21415 [Burkholderiaceae bacterium]|jgi:hypothetical protein|nr:hypothetical protein [Burkholderiaceae bacterium]